MIISSKREMFARYQKGWFGNKLQTWDSLDSFFRSGYSGNVVLRYKGSHGGAFVAYDLAPADVGKVASEWACKGADRALINVNELLPDSDIILQGEVMQSHEHLSLRYSTVKAPMRVSLAQDQKHAVGLNARLLLQSCMDPESFEDLELLLSEYDGAVVEFTTVGRDVGCLPRRNTVFWEVRHY